MFARPSNGLNGFWPDGNLRLHTADYSERWHRIGGLDIGQSHDPSALAVIQHRVYGRDFIGPHQEGWELIKLGTWPLGTDYGEVIKDVLNLKTLSVLCVDATGAKPFIDWFRREASRVSWATRIRPINIATSAMREAAVREKGFWSVPKREIVTALVVMEHKHGLKLPKEDPAVKRLLRELADFKLTISRAANQTFGAKQGSHDDLVMSLGMACWWALRSGVREPAIMV